MKSGNRDKAEGRIKEVAGNIPDNPKLEVDGNVEKITGQIQEKVGQIKKVWKH
jgi:uncharacterized protein YjbJ (UPF0337 family)